MRVSFYNLGCKVNYADIVQIGKMFQNEGHSIVEFGDESDITLINTCTVTEKADADCRKIIRRALKASPDAFIGVLGCYAQLNPGEISEIKGVDAVFGSKEKFDVLKLIENFGKKDTTQIFVSDLSDVPFHTSASNDSGSRTRAFLKIQDGCDYKCTFCTIPKARGASRSIELEEIPAQIDNLINQNFSEIVLTGINLGDYRTAGGKNFKDAVDLIDNLNKPFRARISSIEPNLLTDEILDIVSKSETFCPHFHIPLQSGSQELLHKMKRRYKAEHFEKLVFKIKEKIPDAAIGIDVIIGFPGESEELFMETFNFIKALPAAYLHVFTYSEREGTPAAEMDGAVPKNIRKERTGRLRALSTQLTENFYNSQLGKVKKAIPETYNPNSGMWKGWTENYVKVIFKGPAQMQNKPYEIRLVEIKGDKVLSELI